MINKSQSVLNRRPKTFIAGLVVALSSVLGLLIATNTVSAACSAPSTNYGSASQTVNVINSGTGSYRAWSRIMVPSSTANSYMLEVDGGSCFNVGGNSSIPANTWTWVDYQAGSSKINVTLTGSSTGVNHTVKLIGNAAGVKVDRVIFLTDTNCTPTGTGDNCLVSPPPTTPPTVTLSASPTTVTQGQAVGLSSTATDNAGSNITKVDFYDGSTLLGTDTTGPYSLSWNTTTSTSAGSHSITAKATDLLNLVGTSSPVSVTVNAAPPADTIKPTVSITAPIAGATVSGSSVNITASASDNSGGSGMKNVVFMLDGTTTLATDTVSPYNFVWNSGSVSDGSHTIAAVASDVAGNTNSVTITVNVSNAVPPPADTPPQVTLTAPLSGALVSGTATLSASTVAGTKPIAKVVFTVDGLNIPGGTDTTAPYGVNWDSNSVNNGPHTIMATVSDTNTTPLTAQSQQSVNVDNSDKTPPSTPTNLSATAAAYNRVNLSWTASTDNVGIAGYTLVRTDSSLGTTSTTQLSGTATNFSDTTVSASTSYSYYIFARDTNNNPSANSSPAFVTTPAKPDTEAPTWPSAGANLVASAVSSSQINLSWNRATDNIGVKSYLIYRDNGSSTSIATVDASLPTSWSESGLTANTTYGYIVKAIDAAGLQSVASNTASATTQDVVQPPPTPKGNLAGNVTTVTTSGNPYSCSSHPTLTKLSAPSTDATILACSKRAQWYLNTLNNAGLTVDGWFGGNTETAVKNYQTKFGVTGDTSGTVGSQTWNSMETKGGSLSTNPYSCSSHPTLTKLSAPSTDATILACSKRAQWYLNTLNNAGLSIDGWFGGNSSTAASNYQRSNGLIVNGTIDSPTWNSMESKGGSSTNGFGSGATISYTQNGNQHTVTADNEGYYIALGIDAGSYNFTYSLQNYISQTASIPIVGNQTATYNVTLKHL